MNRTKSVALDADVLDLLDELDAASAEYVIVGAHALAAHGIVRATSDFDVLVRPSTENAERVFRALTHFGAPLSAHNVRPDYFTRPGRVHQMGLPPKRIDLITSISGVEADEAFADPKRQTIGGAERRVLSLEMLIKNKSATGRPKDLLDVVAIKQLVKRQRQTALKPRPPARKKNKPRSLRK